MNQLPTNKQSTPRGNGNLKTETSKPNGLKKILRLFSGSSQGEENGNGDDDDIPLSSNHDHNNLEDSLAKEGTVEDVAVPKADVVAVSDSISLAELVEVFKESERTRVPVFHETPDNPLGFVHLKDIALKYGFNGNARKKFRIRDDLRDLLFVPPSMPINELRVKMQNDHCHMALVIDEYGGVDGLVTIEDLLEHHFGEIIDEHDTEEENAQGIMEIDQNLYHCPAKTPLQELDELLNSDLTNNLEEEVDTLGGWVSTKINRIPNQDEVIPFEDLGLVIKVLKGDNRKMDLLEVKVVGEPPE
ncbi:MAG: CBS domain-containing protein [Rhodobacteraceae bacterium]|nr:CBS domain-containing protein [Paracoccaceae bacterium]